MWRFGISIVTLLALTACASEPVTTNAVHLARATAAPLASNGLPPPTQCALFAREFTGINIRGDAWSWWELAQGQYPRSDVPKADTVLVLRSTSQLKLGHVGIVKKVIGPREILITHANWGNDDPTRRIIHDSTAVVDVSPKNDWTELRFFNAPAHAFGKVYAAYGFIYPKRFDENDRAVW